MFGTHSKVLLFSTVEQSNSKNIFSILIWFDLPTAAAYLTYALKAVIALRSRKKTFFLHLLQKGRKLLE